MQSDGLDWIAGQLVHYVSRPPHDAVEQTIRELNAGTKDGVLDPQVLNKCLIDQLLLTLNGRVNRRFEQQLKVPKTKAGILSWLNNEKFDVVRITIIQTDDGCYHIAKDSDTGSEKAYVDAESASVSAAIDSLGDHGILKVMSMEIRPSEISKNGNFGEESMLYTSTKEGCERIFKRRTQSGQPVTMLDIPLNDGYLTREQMHDISHKFGFTIDELYPGGFGGTGLDAQHRADAVKNNLIGNMVAALQDRANKTTTHMEK
jgi:hypothetical protein